MVSAIENNQATQASLLADYAAYNAWANKQLAEWLRTKPAELMEQEIPSSFPSLKATITHIWYVQDWWLHNLQGLIPESAYGRVFEGTMDDLFDSLVQQSEAFTAYVEQIPDSALQEQCSFDIPTVGEFARPAFEVIQHCMNHSTYHRGQVITIARNLGLTDPPMTDYMFYLLMAKQQAFFN